MSSKVIGISTSYTWNCYLLKCFSYILIQMVYANKRGPWCQTQFLHSYRKLTTRTIHTHIQHTGETLLISHHLQLEPIPPFEAYSSRSCVYGRPQQHCGSTTWWVMVCMRVVSCSVSFHPVPAVPDPRRGCLRCFLVVTTLVVANSFPQHAAMVHWLGPGSASWLAGSSFYPPSRGALWVCFLM